MSAARGLVVRQIGTVVASALFMLLAAITVAFLALRLAPGDPVTAIMGDASNPDLRAQVARDWGLDKPLAVQYFTYLGKLLHGDFGYSYVRGEPVADVLFGDQLLATATLAGAALLIAVVLAPLLAVATAGRRGVVSRLVSGGELVLASAPAFWVGLVLIAIFAFWLRVLPVTSGNGFQRLILPAVTLALPIAAVLAQVIREGIERALEQPFVLTARSRGVGDTAIRVRHGLRHSLIPAATLAGWAVSSLLTGTSVVEEVFGRAGIGRATVEAVSYQDLPVVLGVAILTATVFLTVSVAVDIAYLWIDPRRREVSA
ncbi:ABC transporter permease [Gordonia sinesedis]